MPAQSKITDELLHTVRQQFAENQNVNQSALAATLGVDRKTIGKALLLIQAESASGNNTQPTGATQGLRWENIIVGSLNPRKTFDEQELADLAASIAANGLLQNLVVRPYPLPGQPDRHMLIAGERRYRAIGLLREDGRWPESQLIDCRVINADEGDHLALALLENLQRQDVPPLEEADAFAQLQDLDPEKWNSKVIAAKIGRTTRYVQMRLSFSRKLSPVARHALATKMLTIEGARMLTATSIEKQEEILSQYEDGAQISVQNLEWNIQEALLPVEIAVFDVESSGLEMVELGGAQFFADRKLAVEAQMKAVREQAKALRKEWAFVEVLEPGEWPSGAGFLTGCDVTKENGGGVVIQIFQDDYEVTIHKGCIKREQNAAPSTAPTTISTEDYQKKRAAEQAALEAEKKAEFERFNAVAPKLDSDYAVPPEEDSPNKCCRDGCKFRVLLGYSAPGEFHVCTKPNSPRAGMLTREDQGGASCFEVA